MQSTTTDGRILFLQLPGAAAPALDALLAERLSGTGHCERNRSLHDLVQRGSEIWSTPGLRYLSGLMPASLLPRAETDHAFTVLPRPHAFPTARQPATPRELFSAYFSPGFDDQRWRVDSQIGIALPTEAYADACTVEQAVGMLAGLGAVIDGDRLRSGAMELLMRWSLPPPLVMPAGLADEGPGLADGPAAPVSDFDSRFFDEVARRLTLLPAPDVEARYDHYLGTYCENAGCRIEPHETFEWPLNRPLGQHWHAAEQGDDGRYFRWSDTTAPTLELPLRSAGWYSVRLYLFDHGLEEISATVAPLGSDRKARMSPLRHPSGLVLDAHLHLRGPGWIVVQFEHGPIPERPGADQRKRGFVLGRILLRCLST